MKRQFDKITGGGKRNLYGISLITVISLIVGITIRAEAVIAPASYVIYNEGGTYHAQNGQTGVNDYSGSDASTVIQSVINTLGANGGKIFIKKGTYIITASIDLKSSITIEGEAKGASGVDGTYLSLLAPANYPMFKNTSAINYVTLRDLWLNGRRDGGSTGDLIALNQAGEVYFENIRAANAGRDVLSLTSSEACKSINCLWLNGGRYTVYITSGGNHMFLGGAIAQAVEYNLVLSTTNYNMFNHVEIHDAGYSGVYAVTDKHNTFFDCHFITNYYNGIELDRSTDDKILYCDFEDNSVVGLQNEGINGVGTANGCWIVGNRAWDTRTPKKQVRLLGTSSTTSNFIIESNNCLDNYTTMSILGTGHIVKHNRGYVTDNGGIATVANGGTIAHGLAGTPTEYNVTATVARRCVAVTAVNGTNLTIGLRNDAGTAITTPENVSWHAEYHP